MYVGRPIQTIPCKLKLVYSWHCNLDLNKFMFTIFTARQWDCGKVMFSQACHSVHLGVGGYAEFYVPSGGCIPGTRSLPGVYRGKHPLGRYTPTIRCWHLMVATEAGGTHPTGMLSYWALFSIDSWLRTSGSFSFVFLQQHEGVCQFQLMKCECEDTMPKCWYDEHRKKECSHRKLICPYCNAEIVAKLMEVSVV